MNKVLQEGTNIYKPLDIFSEGIPLNPDPSGILVYKLINRTIFDMRGAARGRYEDKGLKAGDCVVWSDRKIYKVLKSKAGDGATYLKMTKNEINDLKEEIDKAISEKQQTIIS